MLALFVSSVLVATLRFLLGETTQDSPMDSTGFETKVRGGLFNKGTRLRRTYYETLTQARRCQDLSSATAAASEKMNKSTAAACCREAIMQLEKYQTSSLIKPSGELATFPAISLDEFIGPVFMFNNV